MATTKLSDVLIIQGQNDKLWYQIYMHDDYNIINWVATKDGETCVLRFIRKQNKLALCLFQIK